MTAVHDARRAFRSELDEIMRDIPRLVAHVIEAIPKGTEALLTNDLHTAEAIVDEADFGRFAIEAEERCYTVLARQAPVASDLRAIIAAIRIIAEVERSMELAVNVCEVSRRITHVDLPTPVGALLKDLSDEATTLFRLCLDAYVGGDAGLAAALDDLDDVVDEIHADYTEAVLAWGGDGDVHSAVQLALIGRNYERIGDHAVNIGARVRYMVDGWLPEHAGAARARALKRVWVPGVRNTGTGVATRAAG